MTGHKFALILVLLLAFFPLSYNACSQPRPQEGGGTTTGTPDVELYLKAYHSVAVFKTTACITSLVLYGDSGQQTVSLNKAERDLPPLGFLFDSVGLPPGHYTQVDLVLASNCMSEKSLQVTNTNGTFATSDPIHVKFAGDMVVGKNSARLSFDVQAMIDALAPVATTNQVAPAAATSDNKFSYDENATILWTGAGTDSNWSNPANWSSNSVPGNKNVVRFTDSACGTNCLVLLDIPVVVAGVEMAADYSGQIEQGPTSYISIASRGWTQDGGVFIGSAAPISQIGGAFAVTGGTFNHTSGPFNFTPDITPAVVFRVTAAPAFSLNSLNFQTPPLDGNFKLAIDVPNGFNFGDLRIGCIPSVNSKWTWVIPGTVTVSGNFELDGDIGACATALGSDGSPSTIHVHGNATFNKLVMTGPAQVILDGAATQMLDDTFATLQDVTIDLSKPTGSIVLAQTMQIRTINLNVGQLNLVGFSLNVQNLVNNGTITQGGGLLTAISSSGSGQVLP